MALARARARRALWIAVLLVPAAPGCLGADPAGCAEQRARSAELARTIRSEWPLRGQDEVTRAVRAIGDRLARGTARPAEPWRFEVVRHRSPNGYSIGGGRVYVTDGAVRESGSESELAALLAHEMGHELLHLRCGPRAAQEGGRVGIDRVGSIVQEIDPAKEREADEFALVLLDRSGYDPRAALALARRMPAYPGRRDAEARVRWLGERLADWPRREARDSETYLRARLLLAE